MTLVLVGQIGSFAINGPPVDITDIVRRATAPGMEGPVAPNAPERMLTRFPDAANGTPQLNSVSSRCTHQWCPILTGDPRWNTSDNPIYDAATKTITCPCHGSQFNVATGALVRGVVPKQKNLAQFAVEIRGSSVYADTDPLLSPVTVARLGVLGSLWQRFRGSVTN